MKNEPPCLIADFTQAYFQHEYGGLRPEKPAIVKEKGGYLFSQFSKGQDSEKKSLFLNLLDIWPKSYVGSYSE